MTTPSNTTAYWRLYVEHLHGRNPLWPQVEPPVDRFKLARQLLQRRSGTVDMQPLDATRIRVTERGGALLRRG